MKFINIDLETFSSVDLVKCGVYRYAESPDFDILLFSYSVDGGDVKVVDLACGEKNPLQISWQHSQIILSLNGAITASLNVFVYHIILIHGLSLKVGIAQWYGLLHLDFPCLWKMWVQCLDWKSRN